MGKKLLLNQPKIIPNSVITIKDIEDVNRRLGLFEEADKLRMDEQQGDKS